METIKSTCKLSTLCVSNVGDQSEECKLAEHDHHLLISSALLIAGHQEAKHLQFSGSSTPKTRCCDHQRTRHTIKIETKDGESRACKYLPKAYLMEGSTR